MTTRSERRRSGSAPIEAGVAPTEQNEDSVVPFRGAVVPAAAEQPASDSTEGVPAAAEPMPRATFVNLSGPELNDVRLRNDTTDQLKVLADQQALDANRARRAHLYSQEALSGFIAGLIRRYDLDPDFVYRVDLDQAALVAVQRRG